MLIVMSPEATESQIQGVVQKIESIGLKAHPSHGTNRTVIGIIGNLEPIDPSPFTDLPGVAECMRVTKPYKLVGRDLLVASKLDYEVELLGPTRPDYKWQARAAEGFDVGHSAPPRVWLHRRAIR
jgi:DAHP synthase ferredoxin-like domain